MSHTVIIEYFHKEFWTVPSLNDWPLASVIAGCNYNIPIRKLFALFSMHLKLALRY